MATTQNFQVIDRQALKAKLDGKEKFHLWNVLESTNENIPGSKNVPLTRLEEILPSLNAKKDEPIVVYCASFQCTASKAAAEKLVSLGFTDVSAYEGGLKDWKEGNLPLENPKSQSGGCSCG